MADHANRSPALGPVLDSLGAMLIGYGWASRLLIKR